MTWADQPERVLEPGESMGAKRRQFRLVRATLRELHGAGAFPEHSSGAGWDVVCAISGGRLAVTGLSTARGREMAIRRATRQLPRDKWHAVVRPAPWGNGRRHTATVELQLTEFARIIGRLEFLERDRRRLLDYEPDSDD